MRVVQCNIKGDKGKDPKYGPKGNNNDCNCQEKRPKKRTLIHMTTPTRPSPNTTQTYNQEGP